MRPTIRCWSGSRCSRRRCAGGTRPTGSPPSGPRRSPSCGPAPSQQFVVELAAAVTTADAAAVVVAP
ncbi:hypothetical protein A7K94_0215520, partial [Modestobacter sp. VKM Ac-2676]